MTGVFPSVLKTVKVVPVIKKDSKLNYSNYHPISLQYQKAFDTVDHQILLAKLSHYGICGVSNDCFK